MRIVDTNVRRMEHQMMIHTIWDQKKCPDNDDKQTKGSNVNWQLCSILKIILNISYLIFFIFSYLRKVISTQKQYNSNGFISLTFQRNLKMRKVRLIPIQFKIMKINKLHLLFLYIYRFYRLNRIGKFVQKNMQIRTIVEKLLVKISPLMTASPTNSWPVWSAAWSLYILDMRMGSLCSAPPLMLSPSPPTFCLVICTILSCDTKR